MLIERARQWATDMLVCARLRSGRQRKRLRERLGLKRAVALRRHLLGADRREFVLGRRKIRKKSRIGVQARDSRRADGSAFHHVAFPMHVADETALAKGEAACEDGVALVRRGLREDERPGPADRSMG